MAEDTPFPPQHQSQPGDEHAMAPKPSPARRDYKGSDKLAGKVALVTGGDSGIGRAVAVLFAREGCDSAIVYLEEDKDAEEAKRLVEAEGRRCHLIRGDLGEVATCDRAVEETLKTFGRLDILVNNAAEQHKTEDLLEVTPELWDRVFRTNIHAYFYLTRAAVPHMQPGSAIINTTSVNAYKGNPSLIAYSSTKGAITAFTRSIALSLMERGIRVNGVARGPIWTPLIPATFDDEKVANFGKQAPMGRAGQPEEVAPSYVFLASDDASYFTGQVLHPNGGYVVNA
ncbi:SDR family oxidoreductase [Caenispirillum bisanense]|uniref:NAD(P)-dependent dehydrogenase, short-chain alcohol dehydrogenase family n=1 Tax=Caenispirillum bisanense TaxID=414052 RepID=A0A286GH78_9PROT|nr:SDR family oxidoreductase [Caenispirillum bisanense]SOD94860.1 NAD(P)-dependent dehydrogenase, short-chain alcohol dehydrogenase family [Caenispirillum bisanense]